MPTLTPVLPLLARTLRHQTQLQEPPSGPGRHRGSGWWAVPPAPMTRDIRVLAAILSGSGTLHLARPQTFEPLMPDFVPAHREVIVASGVAEVLCGVGLLLPRTRAVAGWASFALLIGVFPGNIKSVTDAHRSGNRALLAAAYARLPLQLPVLRIALKAARGA